MIAEKNDVNLSKLFNYGNKFEIKDRQGKVITAFIRLVGDAELNRARVFAIRKSAELRKLLRKDGTDERIAFIPDVTDVDTGILVDLILGLSLQTYTREALREAVMPTLPAELDSDATLEDQEEYQKKIDEYPAQRNQAIQKFVDKRVASDRKRLEELSKENLLAEYEKLCISDLCEQEMMKKFRDMCVYFGSFRDKNFTQNFFKDFDEFDNLPTEIKDQFLMNYSALELNMDELKK